MFTKEASKLLPTNLGLGSETKLEISAVHFLNKVVLQLRLNGELDTCYEVDTKGIPAEGLGNTPLGSTLLETGQETYSADMDEEELDGFSTIEDGLSNFSIRTRLGNSNNMKLASYYMHSNSTTLSKSDFSLQCRWFAGLSSLS